MDKTRKYLRGVLCFTFFLFIYTPAVIFADNLLKTRVLSLSKGSYALYESSNFSDYYKANNLIDGKRRTGWRSQKDSHFPHIITFEMVGNADITLLKFNNYTDEAKYYGISAKEVEVEFSTESSDSGYILTGSFMLEKQQEPQEFTIQESKARWIRLSIKSNYGHEQYTELRELEAWGVFEFKILRIIANFVWILGLAIILADFSYHEFLSHVIKVKRTKVLKKNSFKRPFLLGMILIAVGIPTSVQKLWLALILGVFSFFLIIWLVKFKKIHVAEE
jgi:hypothetical protein